MELSDLTLSPEDVLIDGRLTDKVKSELIARMRVKMRAELNELRCLPGDIIDLTYTIKAEIEDKE